MPLPFMKPVQSSNISTVGYDEASGDMYVTFRSGRTYKYEKVPASEYSALEQAGSVGSYFAAHIRDQYKTVPV